MNDLGFCRSFSHGLDVCFGLKPLGQLVGVPPGARVRIRQRTDEFVAAFVRQGNTVTHWSVGRNSAGQYVLCLEQARNVSYPA